MQYRRRLQIAKGNHQRQPLNYMLRAHFSALRLSALLLVFGLSACADTMAVEDSPPTSTQLQRHYDKTLTKAEQQAVISDMQSATAKKQDEADKEDTGATGTEAGEKTN
jgi:hypothetical protein